MKYRLRSDASVECETEPYYKRMSDPWVKVSVADVHLQRCSFHMPCWLFDKQWEPEKGVEVKENEQGLPAFSSGCPKCGGFDAESVRYHREVTEKQRAALEARAERLLEAGGLPDLPPMVCEEHLTVTCGCGHVYWTRTKDFG